jgi:hypothetical protein
MSPTGNITRIDNVLEKIPERLELEKAHIEDLHKQLETAKEELGRSFSQAKELEEKSARLAELDILLNMDNRDEPQQENESVPMKRENSVEEKNEEENVPVSDGNDKPEVPEPAVTPLKHKPEEPEFYPKIGQRVVFHPNGGTVTLTGRVFSADEATITLLSGRKKIPVYRNKGIFEPIQVPMILKAAERGSNGVER